MRIFGILGNIMQSTTQAQFVLSAITDLMQLHRDGTQIISIDDERIEALAKDCPRLSIIATFERHLRYCLAAAGGLGPLTPIGASRCHFTSCGSNN
jgi:hypothetical protein